MDGAALPLGRAIFLMVGQCSIYVHDPGPRFNLHAMSAEPNRTLWTDLDHYQHVAYWLHRGLLRYPNRSHNPAAADVIFIAHYFLTYNLLDAPLVFGAPVLQWQNMLRSGGVKTLLQRPALLERWKQRPSDFVAAPILLACTSATLHHVLAGARWLVADPYLGNRCDYHPGFDMIAPLVVSSGAWDPAENSLPSLGASTLPRQPLATESHRRFLTYIGRLGKPYVDYPMSMLRYLMWAQLREHPNVTFLATDARDVVLPNLRDPRCQQPPKVWLKAGVRCCKRCSYGCTRCLEPPSADIHRSLRHGVGTAPRVASKASYRALLASSTFCLVLRGDTESTRKFTEAILSGCIPVLIADMPEWPFAARLDYRKFSFEFDWRAASAEPLRVVNMLLRLPAAEIEAKRHELLRVRPHFFYHDDTSRPGAVTQLIASLCETRHATQLATPSKKSPSLSSVYELRPKWMSVAQVVGHRVGRGAQRGSLHHIRVLLSYDDGTDSDGYVPSEPFRGSAVFTAYLKTDEGRKLTRYVV